MTAWTWAGYMEIEGKARYVSPPHAEQRAQAGYVALFCARYGKPGDLIVTLRLPIAKPYIRQAWRIVTPLQVERVQPFPEDALPTQDVIEQETRLFTLRDAAKLGVKLEKAGRGLASRGRGA